MQGRHKGKALVPNRYWSKEEKLRIVKCVMTHEDSISQIAKNEKINPGQLYSWLEKYNDNGEVGFERVYKKGIPHNRKNMTREEELELENMKLRIENERLKKGYLIEGDGQIVVFNMLNKKNLK